MEEDLIDTGEPIDASGSVELPAVDDFVSESEALPEIPESDYPIDGPVDAPESSGLPVIDEFVSGPEVLPEMPDSADSLEGPVDSPDSTDLPVIDDYIDDQATGPDMPDAPEPVYPLDEPVDAPEPSGLPVVDGPAPETPIAPKVPEIPDAPEPRYPLDDPTVPPEPSGLPVIDEPAPDVPRTPEAPETLDPTYPLEDPVVPPEPSGQPVIDELSDEPVSLSESPEMPEVRIDPPEIAENIDPPVLAYDQGVNDFGYEGTCGPTTVSNSLNTLLGGQEYSENDCLAVAIENGLCNVDGPPEECGGTTTEQLMELYRQIEPERIDVQAFEYGNVLDEEQIAERLQAGDVVNLAVDSQTLWGGGYGFDAFSDHAQTDHWIEVSGVERSDSGRIEGFNIVDSGGGVDYVDAATFHAMYVGTPDRIIDDPTCIVVSRKAA